MLQLFFFLQDIYCEAGGGGCFVFFFLPFFPIQQQEERILFEQRRKGALHSWLRALTVLRTWLGWGLHPAQMGFRAPAHPGHHSEQGKGSLVVAD